MVDVFDRHEVRFDPRLAGCSRFVRYSDFANLAAENERLKQRISDYQRDTSTVDAHETVNVSDKPEVQPEPVVDTEPWGYWVKHKYAEGGLVRTPCFIPEESHYTEVLPLYTSPPTSELEAENARLREINANLMGDDEDTPRYTTKRLKQEIAKATDTRLAEAMKRAEVAETRVSELERQIAMRDDLNPHFAEAIRRVREGGKVDG